MTGTGTKSKPMDVTIDNSGSIALQISVNASALPTGEFKVTGAGSFKLPVSHKRVLTIQFTPSSADLSSESMTITGNINVAAGSSSETVMVTGPAQSGILSAPTALTFGAASKSETMTFAIQNTGLGVLHGKVTASGFAKAFRLLSGGGAFTLSNGAKRVVKVEFIPVSGASPSATVTITSNDPAHMSQSVAVTGSGT